MDVTLFGIVTLVNEGQLRKAWLPIVVSPSTRFISFRPHASKAHSPRTLNPGSRVALVKLSQYEKAPEPIVVTVLGMKIFLNFEQRPKALFPIVVTPDGMVTCCIALHDSKACIPMTWVVGRMS